MRAGEPWKDNGCTSPMNRLFVFLPRTIHSHSFPNLFCQMPPGQKLERHGSVTAVFPIRNGAGVRSRSPRGGRVARRPSSKQSKKCRVLVVILLCLLFILLFKETATLAGQPASVRAVAALDCEVRLPRCCPGRARARIHTASTPPTIAKRLRGAPRSSAPEEREREYLSGHER